MMNIPWMKRGKDGRGRRQPSYLEKPRITKVFKQKPIKFLSSYMYFPVSVDGELEEERLEPGNPVSKSSQ